jgi:hypothetical protein
MSIVNRELVRFKLPLSTDPFIYITRRYEKILYLYSRINVEKRDVGRCRDERHKGEEKGEGEEGEEVD